MIITLEKLQRIFPRTPRATLEQYIEPLQNVARTFNINTKARMSMFLAQVGHECMGFTRISENLNYSWQGLRRTFPRYFQSDAIARQYHRQPEKIANRAYANRMGNGPESSGDGWRYRGRGCIQVTGKNNYQSFGTDFKIATGSQVIAYLETPMGAAMSAGWYWNKNNLNAFADSGNLRECTRRINGGYNGLPERQAMYQQALRVL